MFNYIKTLIKFHSRNSTKEVPIGLVYLGSIGRFLVSPIVEIFVFFVTFCFINMVIVGYSIEENFLSPIFGINPSAIILGVIVQMYYFDFYNKYYRSSFNTIFIKAIPISDAKRFLYLIVSEIVNVKILILPSIIIVLLIFKVANIVQIFNLLFLSLLTFLIYSNISLIFNLFLKNKMRWLALLLNLILCIGVVLSFQYVQLMFDNKNFLHVWFYSVLGYSIFEFLFYLLFKIFYYRTTF